MLFLYVDEMKTYCEAPDRCPSEKESCKLLIDYIEREYKNTKERLTAYLREGIISFDLARYLFKPGTTILIPSPSRPAEERCLIVDYLNKEEDSRLEKVHNTRYIIDAHSMDYDGKKHWHVDHQVVIPRFTGVRNISNLPAYPLEYFAGADEKKRDLVARGRKLLSLANYSEHVYDEECLVDGDRRIHVQGRVLIDPEGYRRYNPTSR